MERVIFRREKEGFLAVFPDDPARPGYYACVPFHFGHDLITGGYEIFEAFCEVERGYYLRTRIVHKNDPETPRLLAALQKYYNTEFCVAEKI